MGLQVKELNAQLDGTRSGGGGGGFDSPAHPDMLAADGPDDGGKQGPMTPDGQTAPRLSAGVYSPEMEQCVRQASAIHVCTWFWRHIAMSCCGLSCGLNAEQGARQHGSWLQQPVYPQHVEHAVC